MSASDLIRWGALAAMVGGVVFLAYPFLFLLFEFGGVVLAIALLLVLLGMVGFHTLQRQSYGSIGRVGFWLVVAGALAMMLSMAVLAPSLYDFPFWRPWAATSGLVGSFVGSVSLVVGLVLYGLATLQARVLSRWCGVAFIAAPPVALGAGLLVALAAGPLAWGAFLFVPVFCLVFGLGWLASGYALWRRREAPATQQLRRVH